VPIIQFKGKTAIESYHRVVPHHTLEIDGKLSVAKKPSLDGNLIIEGDNLIALKSLLPTHAGRIKCIYIDPPYNTGNEGWIYNDNLTQPQFKEWIGNAVGKEGEDACRHDKWCCMMYPRLQLLKELLRDDGAIFVSIDDNEVHHLRMLMDEIFGEENFLCTFAWEKRYGPPPDTKDIGYIHESIVAYKNGDKFERNLLKLTAEQISRYRNPDDDARGPWKAMDYTCRYSKDERPNLFYPIKHPKTGEQVYPNPNRVWAFSREEHLINEKEKRLWWGKDKTASVPAKKNFLNEIQKGIMPVSLLSYEEVGHTDEATKELGRILPNLKMNPKPTRLIQRLVEISSGKDSIILDSFSGSGTTAQAVQELNKEDEGNRKFILVQQPFDTKENETEKFNICEKITRERVLRVSKGYSYKTQSGKTEKVEGLGGEFAYVRVGGQLMGEYRQFGDKLPGYEEVARYIYFTETSQNFDAKKMDEATGKIGECKNTSYYLLYTPDKTEARAMDMAFLKNLKDKNPRKVIYCEKVWVHREDLSQFGDVRPMLVPFNLK
jgi:DNA modification methylase